MWDQRYSSDDFVYGKEPNDFLASVIDRIPRGRVLCLAEGEGRNAVYLAQHGCRVLAVDGSAVGLEKAKKLAAEQGVQIDTVVADLAEFAIAPGSWDAIVSIFAHLPPALRRTVHRQVVAGLRPGGVLVLEAYTLAQLALKTGGPPTAELLMSLETLRQELAGLDLQHAVELEREIIEGRLHTGRGAVVQILATKP